MPNTTSPGRARAMISATTSLIEERGGRHHHAGRARLEKALTSAQVRTPPLGLDRASGSAAIGPDALEVGLVPPNARSISTTCNQRAPEVEERSSCEPPGRRRTHLTAAGPAGV